MACVQQVVSLWLACDQRVVSHWPVGGHLVPVAVDMWSFLADGLSLYSAYGQSLVSL